MDGYANLGGLVNDRTIEREKLSNCLENFLLHNGSRDFEEIRKAYELTKSNESLEAYFNLLQKLEKSKLVFPGFIIENTQHFDYPLQVSFLPRADDKSVFKQGLLSQGSYVNSHSNKIPDVSSLSDTSYPIEMNSLETDIFEVQKRISTNNNHAENKGDIHLSFVLAEKRKILGLLEIFFKRDGNALRYDNLHDAYDIARTTDSDVIYSLLLEKLYESRLDFPGFTLEDSFGPNGNAIQVVFDENRGRQSVSNDNQSVVTQSNHLYDSTGNSFRNYYDKSLPISSDKIHPMENGSSEVTNELKDKVVENIGIHEKRLASLDDDVERLREHIFLLRSETNRKTEELSEEENLDNVKDSFSFIMVAPWSMPAMSGYFIFMVQMATFVLSVSESFETDDSGFKTNPPLNIPKGVTREVHICQGITVFLIIIVQESLWESIADLFNGFTRHLKDQDIQFIWWLIPNLLRFFGGVVALIVTFILVIQGDSVIELLKDFTAMLFVSSFDNIIYFLASVNVIGYKFKTAVDKVEKITYKINENHLVNQPTVFATDFIKKCFVHPSSIGFFFLVILYSLWFSAVLRSHQTGKYLCQKIFVQLDDYVDTELSYFSGTYTLSMKSDEKGFFPTYKETKKSLNINGARHMNLRFCDDDGSKWVFALNESDMKKECDEQSVLVQSEDVELQGKFNVFEVESEDWSVKYKDGRFMPLEDFKISCQDNEEKYSFVPDEMCHDIEADELTGPFETTRTWSDNFKVLKDVDDSFVSVYNHPVYVGEAPPSNTGKDLVFFLGKRWVITSSNLLKDLGNVDLATYLQEKFHGKWSNYTVALFSEPVLVDTPQDTMKPVGLSWYESKPVVKDEHQHVDENKKVSNTFICVFCDNAVNPCFYEGICNSNNKTCFCNKGSSGTLCQVPPTKNGLCDSFFNDHENGYDGGDCCVHTCVSSKQYTCGMDISGSFYVGYDLCKADREREWKKSKVSPFFKQLLTSHISISGNGRVIALIDSISQSVRVYDNDGSSWSMRGTAVTTVLSPAVDSLSLSSNNLAIKYGEMLPSVTVAVNSNSTIDVYEWNYFWEKISDGIPRSLLTLVRQTEIRNVGKTLGLLYLNNSFRLFRRPKSSKLWQESKKGFNTNNYTCFSMSESGTKYVLANQTHIELYNNDEVVEIKRFINEIMSVKISPGGQTVLVFVYFSGVKGFIHRYDISNHGLVEMGGVLRGINYNSTLDVSDDGKKLSTHSKTDNKILFYEWKNRKWEVSSEVIMGEDMSISSDKSSLAVISSSQSSDPIGSSVVYFRNKCENGQMLHFTFLPDDSPSDLTWEISKVTSTGDTVILKNGGPYDTTEMIVQDICIENKILKNDCLGITINDLGLDGLRHPGKAGISIDGKVQFSLLSTDGYKNTFYLDFGNEACLNFSQEESPWKEKYSLSLHDLCFQSKCEWMKIGSVSHGISKDNEFVSASISSDGLKFAIGDSDANNSTGKVQVFSYKKNEGWIKYGSEKFGGQANDMFGSSVYLSADGATLAIGSSGYSVNGTNLGQVCIFVYDENKNDWSQLGNKINGIAPNAKFGAFMSLSADGKTAAVGQTGICVAIVYKYDAEQDKWVQTQCFEGQDKLLQPSTFPHTVRLSSNGLVLAISQPRAFDMYGYVQVYEYSDFTKNWSPRGEMLKGEGQYHLLGYSISMSSDGSTLAITGLASHPILTFEYNKNEKQYVPKGQLIEVLGGGAIDVALSSSGSVLVAAYDQIINTYIFSDEFWFISAVESINLNEDTYFFARTAVSADAVTIAGKTNNTYEIFRLSLQTEVVACEGNFFNLTIRPDKFPEDIVWYLADEDGKTMVLQNLIANEGNEQMPDTLNFTRCVSKESAVYTFSLADTYGDGLCCDWGNGSFTLEWNQETVLKSEGFEDYAIVCLPQTSDISLFSAYMNFTMTTATTISFGLVNSSSTLNILQAEVSVDSFTNTPQYHLCLPNAFDCVDLIVTDRTGNGVAYGIVIGDLSIQRPQKSFFFDKISLGNKCGIEYCSGGDQIFEFIFLTDRWPEEFSWELVDSKNGTLAKGGDYTNLDSHYLHRDCLSVPASECVILRLMDFYNDSGTSYAVSWNGIPIHEGIMAYGPVNELLINNVSCT